MNYFSNGDNVHSVSHLYDSAVETTRQYIEECKFCGQFYCTYDEIADTVALFFHKEDCTVFAQFVATDSPTAKWMPVLLSSNMIGVPICLLFSASNS